jgi:hypothetical protein
MSRRDAPYFEGNVHIGESEQHSRCACSERERSAPPKVGEVCE